MFWTFTFTNPREQANVQKSIFTDPQFSDTLCGNTCCEQISISGMRRSEVSTTSCSRTFTSGSSPMAWFSTASGLNIIEQIHIIRDGGVWMLTIYYGTSMIHLNSSWKQFMSTEGLLKYFPLLSVSENQFFPRNTYFHIYFPLWHFQVRSRPESWYSDSVFSWQSKQTLTFNILFLGNLVRSIPSNCLNSPFMNFGGEGLWCNFVDTLPWPCSRKTALYIACFVSYL